MTSNNLKWFQLTLYVSNKLTEVIWDHLESCKSQSDKISYTINMQRSLSFFCGVSDTVCWSAPFKILIVWRTYSFISLEIKDDKHIVESQEKAYWRVYRPPPGYTTVVESSPVPTREDRVKARSKTKEHRLEEVRSKHFFQWFYAILDFFFYSELWSS